MRKMNQKASTTGRFLALCLTASLMMTMVGCGGAQKSQEQSTNAEGKEVMVLSWFEGGYGKDYVEHAIKVMEDKYPNLEIQADIQPKNHEQLRPQFVAGNPPDVFLANAAFFDYFAVINGGMLKPLNDVLDSPATVGEGTFGNQFLPGVLDIGKKEDQYYLAPALHKFHGMWYDANLLKDKNIDVPVTSTDFLNVSEKLEKEGITPFTFQGLYPFYITRSYLMPAMAKKGGPQLIKDLSNLKEGAWQDERVVEVMAEFKKYTDQYMLDGTLALNHTQAQMEFLNRRVGIIPCGTWLEREMEGNWPEDFDLTFMAAPVREKTTDPTYITMSNTYIAIPKQGKNTARGEEFLKLMYSEEVREYIASTTGATMPIKDCTKGFEEDLPKSVLQANVLVQEEDAVILQLAYELWYKSLHKKINNALTALIMGEYTPEKFCEEVEKEADRIRKDDNIFKYHLD